MSNSQRMASAEISHEGLVRERNEDNFFSSPETSFFVVADGMGGHDAGDRASEAIAQFMSTVNLPSSFAESSHTLSDAIYLANQVIWEESQEAGKRMGSTIVALYVREDQFAVMWVGDSRAYLLRDRAFTQLTKDHTQVQQLVDAGAITDEEAELHPMSHVLSRAVGVEPSVEVAATKGYVEPGDLFLLCSDGLTSLVSDHEIENIIVACDIEIAAQRLFDLAMKRGAPDNITLILAAVADATQLISPFQDVGEIA